MSEKIDIVYTWVNGNDREWLKKKEAIIINNPKIIENKRVNANERYNENNELMYSLRSIEKYVPWINNIYIITDNQIPKWLNLKNTKIQIIDHQDIFDNKYLPNFNSSSIETNLHKIKGLSDYFLYLNDDLFVGRYTNKSDFFYDSNKTKLFCGKNKIKLKTLNDKKRANEFQYAILNSRKLIYDKYKYFASWDLRHGIKALDKKTLSKIEKIFPNNFKITRDNKFRHSSDTHIMSLYAFYMVAKKLNDTFYLAPLRRNLNRYKIKYFRKNRDYTYVPLTSSSVKTIINKFEAILKYKPLMFCINDGPNVNNIKREISKKFLEKLYPIKSKYEK